MSKKEEEFIALARKRFDQAEKYEHDDRLLAQEDFAFAAGDGQWPSDIEQMRLARGQPCLRINRFPQFLRNVTGDARQNKPGIKVHPTGDGASKKTADIYEGLVRNIEAQSKATEAYITGLGHAVAGSRGHWRVISEYSDDDFVQDLRIRRINNPFSVYWDPNAQEYDKSDAKWCFVTDWMTKDAFEDEYPKDVPDDWEAVIPIAPNQTAIWTSVDKVRIAEYWVKEPYQKTIAQLQGGSVIDVTDLMDHLAMFPIEQVGGKPKLRKVDSHKVRCYKMTGHAILDSWDWAGKYIPIVSVWGPEEFLGERSRNVSLIRHSKDAQRMYNYWKSANAEKIALAPKAPFILASAQIKGHENEWKAANSSNMPYLTYNHVAGIERPERQAPALVNQAEIMESHSAVDDMKATMGIYDPSLGNQSNETSGRAILARQKQGSTATFEWIDNLARSIEHTGRILVDAIPKYYDTERVVRVLGEDDSVQLVPINLLVEGQQINDLTVGKYDVYISVGPSYGTKRLEAADSMMSFVNALPQAGQAIMDLIAKNMDWDGADEIAERLQKMLPPGVADPKKMSPEDQQAFMQQQQQAMQKQQEVEAIGKAKAQADIERVKAETAQVEAAAFFQVLTNRKLATDSGLIPTTLKEEGASV